MATQYSLTNAFTAITEEKGTIQNVGTESVELASTTNTTEGEGIILLPGEKRAFNGNLSARAMGDVGANINVVDFTEAGEGGDVMTGASASADGTSGLVPQPTAGNENRFLRGDGTWAVPTDEDTQYQPATQLADGLMSSVDKTKLDNIESGANNYTLPKASAAALGGVKSSDIDGDITVNAGGTMSVNFYGYRKAGTDYAVGDVRLHNTLDINKKLVCVKAGTSASSALTLSSTDEGAYITDGTCAWVIDPFADGDYRAIHQNGIGGGADITDYWTSGDMSTNIQAGKFVGMHIGDYITKTVTLPAITYTDKAGVEQTQAAQTFSNVKWLVAAIDPHIHCGDTETTTHHVLLIPASTLQCNVKMNPTNDTTGAYTGSDMWRVHMPNWANAIKTAFGSGHVLKHRELLANAINATAPSGAGAGWVGTASGWAWVDVEVNIPNEQMIYGGRVWGSGFDGGDFPRILPLYALKCSHLDDRSWFWLRAVAAASNFARASGSGNAAYDGASYSDSNGGVRPYFLAH